MVLEKCGLQCQNAKMLELCQTPMAIMQFSPTHGHHAVHTNIVHLGAMEREGLTQDAVQSEDHKPNSEMKSESPDNCEGASVQTSLLTSDSTQCLTTLTQTCHQ